MMPKDFDACVKSGGRVRTKKLSGGRFMHICIPQGGGPGVGGEIKTKPVQTPARRVYANKSCLT